MQLVCIKELNIHYTLVYAFTCCITVSVCSVVASVAAAVAAASECSRLAVFQSAVFVCTCLYVEKLCTSPWFDRALSAYISSLSSVYVWFLFCLKKLAIGRSIIKKASGVNPSASFCSLVYAEEAAEECHIPCLKPIDFKCVYVFLRVPLSFLPPLWKPTTL